MASSSSFLLFLPLCLSFLCYVFPFTHGSVLAPPLGINFGPSNPTLPTLPTSISLIKSLPFGRVKLMDSDPFTLFSLANSTLEVVVGVPNQHVELLSLFPFAADLWIQNNLLPHYPSTKIVLINIGNEVLSNHTNPSLWHHLLPAMKNMYNSLDKLNLSKSIKVTTSIAMDALHPSSPPSAAKFRTDIASHIMKPMLHFLSRTNSYFFVNVYPYFEWASNVQELPLDYALFGAKQVVLEDGDHKYSDMLSAELDAIIVAMEKMGHPHTRIAISETGWPSDGGFGASLQNAATYNKRLIERLGAKVQLGTPRRPGKHIPAHIFSLYDDIFKPGPMIERNWGLYYTNGTAKYSCKTSNDGYNGQLESKASLGGQLPILPTPAKDPLPPYGGGHKKKKKKSKPMHAAPPAKPSDGSSSHMVFTFPAKLPSAWCVANASMDETLVEEAMEIACAFGGADCGPIEPGKACFEPNSLPAHASYVFNSYWQRTKHVGGTCTFDGAAMLTRNNPSYEGCTFEYKD